MPYIEAVLQFPPDGVDLLLRKLERVCSQHLLDGLEGHHIETNESVPEVGDDVVEILVHMIFLSRR